MSVKLLTEQHLKFLSLKAGCTGSYESTNGQNVTLLEITCHGLIILLLDSDPTVFFLQFHKCLRLKN